MVRREAEEVEETRLDCFCPIVFSLSCEVSSLQSQ